MHKEAIRYLNNTKEILKTAPIEGRFYGDKKPACGKLLKEFNGLYNGLYIWGYYRGEIYNIDAARAISELLKSL